MAVILVVDDSASMRKMVEYSLEIEGHEIQGAVDGVQAHDMALRRQFDVIVTDVHMPNMNGIELVEALRQIPRYRYVPILVMTTDSDDETKVAGKKAGATGWVIKPFDPSKLAAMIQRVV